MALTGADKPRSYDGDYMVDGRFGEEVCFELLRRSPNVVEVEDLRDVPKWQQDDVDCRYVVQSGTEYFAEFKSDSHLGRSDNVLFEALRINHTAAPENAGTLGWSFRSAAQWLYYYAPTTEQVYRVWMDDLRRVMQQYTSEARKTVRVDWVSTDSIKSTVNILVPRRYWEPVFKVFDASAVVQSIKAQAPVSVSPTRGTYR